MPVRATHVPTRPLALLRDRLRCSCVLLVTGAILMPSLAHADGGAGGTGSGQAGRPGGSGYTGNSGTSGNAGTGAGGGGGGAGGGNGGSGGSGDSGAGAGGTAGTPNGGNGGSGLDGGGGGGGYGGANGNGAGAATITNATPLAGGNGGTGGSAGTSTGGYAGGGGGGAGGYGAIVTGTGSSSNSSSISGGTGGAGGTGMNGGGNGAGGDGGYGVQFTTSGAIFTNSGTVTGGNGGAAGGTGAANGAGGVGIAGSGLTIINNGGTIRGGLSGDGVTRANAITFTGGTNSLEIDAGSTITGNVVAFSAADTLTLGGTTNFSFDVSQIGATAQYQNFGVFTKTGSSNVTLNNSSTVATPWTITAGTLTAGSTGAFGTSSAITLSSGGTLDLGGFSNTISSLAGSGIATDSGAAATLTVGGSSSTSFSGQLTGANLALTVGGTGTLTLSGNNTYSGTTTVNSGANLVIGSGGTTGSLGSGAVTDNGQLYFNHSDSITLPAITGTGSVTQAGSGTLTINTVQAYTGGTGISAGTLALTGTGSIAAGLGVQDNGTFNISGTTSGASIATLVGSGGVTLGSQTLTLTNASSTFSGVASGAGGLSVTGGTEKLSGTNNYTGTTTIGSGATLQIGTGGTSGQLGTGRVTNNGTLAFNHSDNIVVATVISGAGALNQIGQGSTFLTGANTYTGTTTISSGSVIIGNNGTSGSLGTGAISVTNQATLGFYRTDTITVANTISGSGGALTQAGSGTVILTGTVTTGQANIYSGGTLQIGNGGTSGTLSGPVVDSGTLVYNLSNSATYSGVISGTGTLTQAGSGMVILDGVNSYTGGTTVSAGILEVGDTNTPTASLAGGVAVGSGGTLEGHGTVNGAVTVASGGTLRPGGSIGTLTVKGAVSIPAGTTFTEEFSNTAGSNLAASGAVTLGGALQLVSDSTTYTSGTDYKFITGSSVTGTFSSVSGAPAGVNTTVQYSASVVDLILGAPSATPAVTNTFLFSTYGKTPNQIAAGAALTASSSTAPLYLALGSVVATNTAAVPVTLGQLAGDIHPSLRSAAIEDARMVRDTMLGHMNRDPDGPILWAAGFGNVGNISDSNAANLGHRSGGFLVGGDLPIAATANTLRLGLVGGYSTDSASTAGHLSTANGNEGHAGAYVTYTADQVHFYAGDDYGFGSVKLARSVSTLGAVLGDSQTQHSNQLFAELGYRAPWELPLEPYLGIAKVSSSQGAFIETGGIAALSGAAASDSEAFSTLGLRSVLTDSITLGDVNLMPHFDLGWQHALQRLTPSQTVTFQNTGQSFLVLGVPLSTDTAKVKLGVEVKQGPATLFLDYNGEFASRVTENGISGGIDWQF